MEPTNPQSPNLTPGVTPNPVTPTPTPTTPPVPPSPFVSEQQTTNVVSPMPEDPKKSSSPMTLAIVLMVAVLIIALGYIAYTKFSAPAEVPGYTQESLDILEPTDQTVPEEEFPVEEDASMEPTDEPTFEGEVSAEVTPIPTSDPGAFISE